MCRLEERVTKFLNPNQIACFSFHYLKQLFVFIQNLCSVQIEIYFLCSEKMHEVQLVRPQATPYK